MSSSIGSSSSTASRGTANTRGSTSNRNTPFIVTQSRSGRMSICMKGNTSTSNLTDRQLRMVLRAMSRELNVAKPPTGIGRANVLNRIRGLFSSGQIYRGKIKKNDEDWAKSY